MAPVGLHYPSRKPAVAPNQIDEPILATFLPICNRCTLPMLRTKQWSSQRVLNLRLPRRLNRLSPRALEVGLPCTRPANLSIRLRRGTPLHSAWVSCLTPMALP